jgi:hypothetical protein
MSPLSLPNATIEPVKVTAPTNTPTYTSISWMIPAVSPTPPGAAR